MSDQHIPEGHYVVEDADGERLVKKPSVMQPMAVVGPPIEPATVDEARAFHNGFIAGLTAYAAAIGHSGLKSENETLRTLMDKQGWETVETFERITGRKV